MNWWNILKRDVGEFFTTDRTRKERRQCEFHLRVAEPLREAAFGQDEAIWREYYEEVGRAIAANPNSVEARYLRSQAAQHWFETLRPAKPDPLFRDLERAWDRDLQFILTHFPDRPSETMTLKEARDMRTTYDRICRGIRI